MHRMLAVVGCVTLSIVIASSAVAEDFWQPPRVEFGGYGGVMSFDHARGLAGNVYGGRFGVNFSPRVGFEAAVGRTELASDRLGFQPEALWITQANLVFHLVRGQFEPFLSGGLGNGNSVVAGGSTIENQFGFDFGGGLKLWMTDNLAVRGDLHSFWSSAEGAQSGGTDNRYRDLQATVGMSVGLGDSQGRAKDLDSDGVLDDVDRCPNTPYGVTVDVHGCPTDADGDGVPDFRDRCADTPAEAFVDVDGCPKDSDEDGVVDGVDRCEATPRGAVVDEQGCPLDSDGDGVYDGLDMCLQTAAGVEVDDKGCEVVVKVAPIERRLILHNITFASGSAEILTSSYVALNQVANSLIDNPETEVEVRGYADAQGSDSYNLVLTQKRADAVRAYLIARGVEASRLMARGFGETQPIATNDTFEGRAMNRRVEFHRIDTEW